MPAMGDRPKKILIVDDEPDVVSYLEMLFHDHGYETVTAPNGAEGMKKARQERPDLVTLDISMPESSGTRFYKELKTDPELSSIAVIIVTAVTGYGGDPYGYEKFIRGRTLVPPPQGFFPKPIEADRLLHAIQEILTPANSSAG
jgi:CheY-like chemotaxis protein